MVRLVQNLARAPCCELLFVFEGAMVHACMSIAQGRLCYAEYEQEGRPLHSWGNVGILRLTVGEQLNGALVSKRRPMLCRV